MYGNDAFSTATKQKQQQQNQNHFDDSANEPTKISAILHTRKKSSERIKGKKVFVKPKTT